MRMPMPWNQMIRIVGGKPVMGIGGLKKKLGVNFNTLLLRFITVLPLWNVILSVWKTNIRKRDPGVPSV
jgi:hypothetical protein